jgi:hypothetical protein
VEAKVGKDRPMCSISKPRYIRYTSCCAVVVGGGGRGCGWFCLSFFCFGWCGVLGVLGVVTGVIGVVGDFGC